MTVQEVAAFAHPKCATRHGGPLLHIRRKNLELLEVCGCAQKRFLEANEKTVMQNGKGEYFWVNK